MQGFSFECYFTVDSVTFIIYFCLSFEGKIRNSVHFSEINKENKKKENDKRHIAKLSVCCLVVRD